MGACSARIDEINTKNVDQIVDEFVSGKAELDCYLACATRFGSGQATMRNLHDAGRWDDLAKLVITIGYNQDISWYYLGRSAEGLGLHDAALTYYKRAISSEYKCLTFMLNVCSGLAVPETVNQRIAMIDGRKRR
ncbi:hypothetical protein TSO221_00725 [Azospirillum sp. TSO22-1]|nr:hypothetical protein TSO221_00725 [Azospirillum sp. TSO22-1]